MKKLTYKEAYDKLITAYFRDEIKPLNPNFCFCGTLEGNNSWFGSFEAYAMGRHYDGKYYNGHELYRMESALLENLICNEGDIGYEETIFTGFCAALEVLKQIHIERGEVIEEMPELTKRVLS